MDGLAFWRANGWLSRVVAAREGRGAGNGWLTSFDWRMAEVVLVRQVLVLMGFTVDGANAMTNDGLSSWEELSLQTDDDIESVCKSIRKPGGADAGVPVAHTAESDTKLLCYYLRHQKRRSLPPNNLNMTLVNIRRLRSLRDQE
jgi:hypothetical protein